MFCRLQFSNQQVGLLTLRKLSIFRRSQLPSVVAQLAGQLIFGDDFFLKLCAMQAKFVFLRPVIHRLTTHLVGQMATNCYFYLK